MFSKPKFGLLGLIAILLLGGCGSMERMASGWGRDYESDYVPANVGDAGTIVSNSDGTPEASAEVTGLPATAMVDAGFEMGDDAQLESLLRTELSSWMGTPYVLGGTSLRGVDCSGLVQRVFSDALGVSTPRTTKGLKTVGHKIRGNALKTGDLVFFEPGNNYTHVGIFLGDGKFVHASSSSGVMISDLSENYWQRTYSSSRRILNSSH